MTKKNLFTIFILFSVISCSNGSGNNVASTGSAFPEVTGPNTMSIHVSDVNYCNTGTDPNTGSNAMYSNEPCVSITVCDTNNLSNCVTVPQILLDTGSYGLRIFSSVLSGLTLSAVTATAAPQHPLAECAQFATGATWGPVVTANVQLGAESFVQIPIQLIDSSYMNYGSQCSNSTGQSLDTDPLTSGFNGILGVGLKEYDCGSDCHAAGSQYNFYYSCASNSCASAGVLDAKQVINPVAALPVDNNGVIVTFGSVPTNGAISDGGQLVIGIGTESNNSPSAGVTVYPAASLDLNGVIDGYSTSSAFLDTGSNGVFFQNPTSYFSIPDCSFNTAFFCPSSLLSLAVSLQALTGGSVYSYSQQISNAEGLFDTGNTVFYNVGGGMTGSLDLGLPFFLGRSVYVGIENHSATFNGSSVSGPFWAF